MTKKPVAFRLSEMTLSLLDELVAMEKADSRTEMLERMIYNWHDLRLLRQEVDAIREEIRQIRGATE